MKKDQKKKKRKTGNLKKIPARKRSLCPRRAMKGVAIMAAVFLTLYFSLCFCLDRGFLQRDLGEKYGQVAGATTMTLRMIGPPHKPVLSVSSLCQNYAAYMHLSWTSDDQMDYFDIDKDGTPLVAGLIENYYNDQMVRELSGYAYSVTAFNPLGQNTSDPVSATALDCGEPPIPPPPVIPDPTCVITKFQNINLAGFKGVPGTKERMPKFYGITNMPNAVIEVVIMGETSVIATTTANQNGYWTWEPQNKLNYGTHTIWVTAIDPNDSARKKTASLKFKINTEEENKQKDEENKKQAPAAPVPGTAVPPTPILPISPGKPIPPPPENISGLDLTVRVKNLDNVAYPGRKLLVETTINIVGKAANQQSELQYWIIDENDNEVFRDSEKAFIGGDMTIGKDLMIPRLLKPGKYKIQTDVMYQGTRYIAEDAFTLKEVPLVNLGAGITLTLGQIMRNLFWVILWLLIMLLLFLTLLAIERWISGRAIIHITEENLRDKGLITRR